MDSTTSIKTLEFKLSLNNAQRTTIDRWLNAQRRVWNLALELLIEFDLFSTYNKSDKSYYPCSPLPWEYRWVPLSKETEWRDPAIVQSLPARDKMRTTYLPIPYVTIAGRNGYLYCPRPLPYRQPRIKNDSMYGVVPCFAYKLHPDKPWMTDCPYKITQSTIKELCTAWAEFKKGKRESPRFKSATRNPLKTLSNAQGGNARLMGNDRVKMPGLPPIKVRGVDERFTAPMIDTYRIIKEPSGYYLMLVGKLPAETLKPSSIKAGFDAGIVHLLTDDAGKFIESPAPLDRRLVKLKQLQQKYSRQVKGSANQRKTQKAISKLHEKIRRDRKSYSHKISTYAVRKFGSIAVESLKLQNMTKAPKAKQNESGTGYAPNGAAAKAGLNKKLLDAGFGQLFTLMESKCTHHGRIFERVNPQYTSQTCNRCGHVAKENRLTQSEFRCVSCGHTANADQNAAQNIRDKAFPRGSDPGLAGRMPASGSTECQQEGSIQISLPL